MVKTLVKGFFGFEGGCQGVDDRTVFVVYVVLSDHVSKGDLILLNLAK